MTTTSDHTITILIAEDHPVYRKGLQDVLRENHRLSVIGETGDGQSVVGLVRQLRPDILLLDLNMPGANGLDIVASLREEKIPVKIIILTMHKEERIFSKAMDLGVEGYVLKESAVHDILESIAVVRNGDYFISPAISQLLLKRKLNAEILLEHNPNLEGLTCAERKVLKYISENKTSKEIAEALFVSIRTVENHRMNICNKLNLHGSNALIKFAIENKSYL